jgi:hypothetical protein
MVRVEIKSVSFDGSQIALFTGTFILYSNHPEFHSVEFIFYCPDLITDDDKHSYRFVGIVDYLPAFVRCQIKGVHRTEFYFLIL